MCSVAQLCLTLCDPTDSSPAGSSVHEVFQNTGVGCHFFLHGIFLTQELNPCLLRLMHSSGFFTAEPSVLLLIILRNFEDSGRLRERENPNLLFISRFPVIYFILPMFEVIDLSFNDLSYHLSSHFTWNLRKQTSNNFILFYNVSFLIVICNLFCNSI